MSVPGIIRLSDELSDLDLGDVRLNQRASQLAQTLGQHPDRSIPAACRGWHETKAAYRLLDSDKVTAMKLLEPHYQCTRERMMEHDTVLCIQDTTELDYTGKNDIEGLGTLNYENRKGFYLHPTLAVTPQRLPLGILDSWTWARPLEEAKESIRWVEGYQRINELQQYLWEQAADTHLVYMADREADIYALYAEHQQQQQAGKQTADWLIRCQHDRNTQNEEKLAGDKLKASVEQSPELGRVEFDLPGSRKRKGQKGRKGRKVTQCLKAARVTLRPPQGSEYSETIEVTVVMAQEINPPESETPIQWLLLTNREVTTLEQAEMMLDWYLCRWQIEVFFRILKSGCKVEELQLEKIERLELAVMFYMLIAWRVHYFTMIGRDCPEMSCDLILDEEEWQAVYIVARQQPPPQKPPTINEMLRMIAGFGGFLNRKGDGMPGPQTIWIGLQRSKDFVLAITAKSKADLQGYG